MNTGEKEPGGTVLPPREVAALSDELERLLSLGQPPIIEVLLQERFLRIVLPSGIAAWTGFCFPVALSLAERIPGCSFDGFPLDDLDSLEELLSECAAREVPPWPGASGWKIAAEDARRALREARRKTGSLLETEAGLGTDPGARLGSEPSARRGSEPGAAGHPGFRVCVPTVAKVRDYRPSHPAFRDLQAGTSLLLRAEAQATLRSARKAALTLDGPVADETRAALETALESLPRLPLGGAPSPGNCWIRAGWLPSAARLTGKSVMLPFLVLAAAARSRLSAGAGERSVAPGVAMTGVLDGTRVLPVEESGLVLKVRACFFSDVWVLFVPAGQRETALSEVRRLAAAYPRRQLLVEEVRDAAEIWNHPHALQTRVRGPREMATAAIRRLRVSRVFLLLLLAFGCAAGALTAYQSWLYRSEPEAARWRTDAIQVSNPSERDFLTIEAPPGPGDPFIGTGLGSAGNALLVRDLDGIRPKEIVALLWNENREADRIAAWDRRGKLLWELHSTALESATVPGLEDVWWRAFTPAGTMADGHTRLLALRRSTQRSYCRIDLFDGATGRRIGSLRNDGHIEGLERIELGSLPAAAVFLPGQNNPTGFAVLALVDPGKMSRLGTGSASLDVPALTDPACLEAGVLWTLRFAGDAFTTGRPACQEVRSEGAGVVRASVCSQTEVSVSYYLNLSDSKEPRLASVQITDASRWHLLSRRDLKISAATLAEEEARLARAAQILRPEGWRELANNARSSLIVSPAGEERH